MRILVVCPHFEPDTAPTGDVMTRIVHELAARGHHLEVLTSLPWYREHRIEDGWGGRIVAREDTGWGRITRVHPFPPADKRSLWRRALSFAGFTALVTTVGLPGRRVDVVLAMSPPLTLGLAGKVLAVVRRAPLVFNIQDVFPDVAIEVGALTGRRAISAARWLEKFTYARSSAVTVLSDDLAENLRAKVEDPTRVRVIPNFVDTAAIRPGSRMTPYRRELGIGHELVVMYAGNVGFSQPLELMVDAARSMVERDDVRFVVNGGGSALEGLRRRAADLPNVVFAPYQPRERLSEVLSSADLHLVLLREGLARSSVPSKTFSILAAGRPVLASVDPGSEISRVVETAGAGVSVPPEDPTAFRAALVEMLSDREALVRFGRSGRSYVESWLSPAAVALEYERLFGELGARSR